ncbi:uncharacterized protein LOC143215093 [Lasioglossum baleicum]|uniref:uncharacterized protein LOC143215093 n=1 Tax=Lasioglossum baleicum TaxID=434251 RepID=UPI003FCCB7BA
MLRIKIIEAALRPKCVTSLIKRCAMSNLGSSSKRNTNNINDNDDEDELNKPIKYSTSKAATWPANGLTFDKPQYQGIIISISLAIFLGYFLILREENDIDEKMTTSMDPEVREFLYGIKKQQEKSRIEYMKTV